MNILSIKRITLYITLAIISVSCTTYTMTKEERTQAYAEYIKAENLESIKKITAFRFDGWSPLEGKHLIISTTFNKPYLITLKSRCPELRYANAIQIHNTGSILQTKLDSISVPGEMGIRCYIETIHVLDREQKKYIQNIGREEKSKEAEAVATQ